MKSKTSTLVFVVGCMALTFLLAQYRTDPRLNDPRLYGTWLSDRERTLNPFSSDTSDELSTLFGKLKVTFSESAYTTELDDFVETMPYTVLGIDAHSVVIRDDLAPDADMASLGLSTFTKIHFEGDDAYWLTTEIGGYREYFKRVPDAQASNQKRAEP